MEEPVEIRYSGVNLGRVNEMPNAGEVAAPFFLPMREPLPVGTVLQLRMDDRETPVRVVHTVESPDPEVAGMHVRAIGESEIVAFEFIPAPVPMLDAPKPEPAAPFGEIDEQQSATEKVFAKATSAKAAVAETGVARTAIGKQVQAASTLAADSAVPVAVEATISAASGTEAVPEAVPTAVGSSPTDALADATDSVATDGEAVSSETADESSASSGIASTEDLPPARPIFGLSGRRKTKRRK